MGCDHKMIYPDIPDKDVQAALGIVAIRHGHLEYILKMTVKSLCGLSIEEALTETNKQNARRLRKRIEDEALKTLEKGEALEWLIGVLHRSWQASDLRNTFIHNMWAKELDGPLLMQNDDHTWRLAPTDQELQQLSDEIQVITKEINTERLEGKLFAKLEEKKSAVA